MKITTINTIELSSKCDNSCDYCPAKDQHRFREVGFMSMEVFGKAVDWALHFARAGTQREINLFGIGEPTLNPDIVKMVRYARQILPFQQKLHLNTNGNTMTREFAIKLKEAGITSIDITAHKARAAAETIRIFREVGIPGQISLDFVTNPNDWAGQVDWLKYEGQPMQCPWLHIGQATIQSDGVVTVCCWDAWQQGQMGVVTDDLTEMELKPFNLCKTCHQVPPVDNKSRFG